MLSTLLLCLQTENIGYSILHPIGNVFQQASLTYHCNKFLTIYNYKILDEADEVWITRALFCASSNYCMWVSLVDKHFYNYYLVSISISSYTLFTLNPTIYPFVGTKWRLILLKQGLKVVRRRIKRNLMDGACLPTSRATNPFELQSNCFVPHSIGEVWMNFKTHLPTWARKPQTNAWDLASRTQPARSTAS